MKNYTFVDLQGRYDLAQDALYKFISRHLDEINKDGAHAVKTQNKWFFDDIAVARLDRLRNFAQLASDTQNNQQLHDMISNLQQQLIIAQNAIIGHLETISGLKGQLIEELNEKAVIKDKLASASFELLRLQSSEMSTEKVSEENQKLNNSLLEEAQKTNELRCRIDELKNDAEKLKKENENLKRKILSSKEAVNISWNWSRRRATSRIVKLAVLQK